MPERFIGADGPDENDRPWRLVFFGSAEFSLPTLKALAAGPEVVALVVTSPPAPAGRGRRLRETPVAELAKALHLPLLEAASFKNPDVTARIRAARPDLLTVAAFRGFLPPALLNLCACPPINLHPSLLPRHRGAAPVNWTLIHGDSQAGVSIIFLEEKMDAGPILSQTATPVGEHEKAGELEARLARAGAAEMLKVLAGLKGRHLTPRPQEESRATVNPLLSKRDGLIDWRRPAAEVARRINGVDPWPGAHTYFRGKLVKMFGAAARERRESGRPGQVLGLDEEGRLAVGAAPGVVAVAEWQPEGKKRLQAAEFQRGYQPDLFTSEDR